MPLQQPIQHLSKDELLEKCLDLRLPVSRFDSYQTLDNFLKAASDENDFEKNENHSEVIEEEEPVYLGKYFSFKYVLGKVLTLI
ncbi:MAG: hypothetical protein IPM56_13305 [Ignavibacteriales bacterium]|nr:MAG: hypothetical protein IPM56_13305 [Ignavibacteriales bacterium]